MLPNSQQYPSQDLPHKEKYDIHVVSSKDLKEQIKGNVEHITDAIEKVDLAIQKEFRKKTYRHPDDKIHQPKNFRLDTWDPLIERVRNLVDYTKYKQEKRNYS